MTKGTIQLHTKHLFLRPFVEEDYESSYHNWLSQEEVFQYMDMERVQTLEESKTYVTSKLKYYSNQYFYDWCIEDKSSKQVVGEINAVRTKDKKGISIGYCLGKNYWKKGYMKECFEVLIPYFFKECGYTYIEADCVKENKASIQLLSHFNFKQIANTKYQLTNSDI